MCVVLEVLGGCDLDAESRLELEPPGLVQKLLIAAHSADLPTTAGRPALDVDVVGPAAERPPRSAGKLFAGDLDRGRAGLSVDAHPRVRGGEGPCDPVEVAPVGRWDDRHRAFG